MSSSGHRTDMSCNPIKDPLMVKPFNHRVKYSPTSMIHRNGLNFHVYTYPL
jgi:hypothetical protein